MRTEISRLHKKLQTTMIYVTHDQIEAMSMGDRIVVMNKGVVQQMDTPLTIYNTPANRFVAGFIGSPTMNFFEGKIMNEGGGLLFKQDQNGATFPIHPQYAARVNSYLNQSVTLGIRPEHITAKQNGEASHRIPTFIEVTEPVGNEIFVYFKLGQLAEQYVSRIPAEIQPPSGAVYEMYVDTAKFHFFDAKTGKSF
jgi:multiple sugar transport system ATP-binding protein